MTLGIAGIAHAFGGQRIDNVEEGRKQGFEEAFIRTKLGIGVRYAATSEQATSDLATAAARAVLEKTGTRAEDIEALVVVTQTPDYQMPHTAALVQRALGVPTHVASFDMSLGCSGWVYGLATLLPMMEASGFRRALLVTADCYSKVMDPADRATAPLFSDAAAATLLTDAPLYRTGKTVFGTDGGGVESIVVKCGGSRAPAERSSLYMDGRAVYTFAMSRIPRDVEQCLALNGLALGDVDCFLLHQANRFMLESLRDRMKLPPGKVVIAVDDGGNTVGSSIPIALEGVLAERPRRILVCGFGIGLSWATNLLELCD